LGDNFRENGSNQETASPEARKKLPGTRKNAKEQQKNSQKKKKKKHREKGGPGQNFTDKTILKSIAEKKTPRIVQPVHTPGGRLQFCTRKGLIRRGRVV